MGEKSMIFTEHFLYNSEFVRYKFWDADVNKLLQIYEVGFLLIEMNFHDSSFTFNVIQLDFHLEYFVASIRSGI